MIQLWWNMVYLLLQPISQGEDPCVSRISVGPAEFTVAGADAEDTSQPPALLSILGGGEHQTRPTVSIAPSWPWKRSYSRALKKFFYVSIYLWNLLLKTTWICKKSSITYMWSTSGPRVCVFSVIPKVIQLLLNIERVCVLSRYRFFNTDFREND